MKTYIFLKSPGQILFKKKLLRMVVCLFLFEVKNKTKYYCDNRLKDCNKLTDCNRVTDC